MEDAQASFVYYHSTHVALIDWVGKMEWWTQAQDRSGFIRTASKPPKKQSHVLLCSDLEISSVYSFLPFFASRFNALPARMNPA